MPYNVDHAERRFFLRESQKPHDNGCAGETTGGAVESPEKFCVCDWKISHILMTARLQRYGRESKQIFHGMQRLPFLQQAEVSWVFFADSWFLMLCMMR